MKKPQVKHNESALACAARRGDKDALARLLQDNWPWLKGLVYNVLGNTDDVDEALQDVCVLTLKKISTLREPERFRGWLAVVARNAALGLRQKRSRRPIQLEELLTAEQMDGEENGHVVNQLIRQEQHQQVLEAITMLPEKYREVFILKYMKDLSYAQIGEILDLPLTTIQIRLVRARRMIYNRMTGKPADKVPRT